MTMSSDIAHKFWFGRVNLMAALTRKQMVAKGPVPKVLKLLPAIKPSYEMYPKYLVENGTRIQRARGKSGRFLICTVMLERYCIST